MEAKGWKRQGHSHAGPSHERPGPPLPPPKLFKQLLSFPPPLPHRPLLILLFPNPFCNFALGRGTNILNS